jgi:hypothetical protein
VTREQNLAGVLDREEVPIPRDADMLVARAGDRDADADHDAVP